MNEVWKPVPGYEGLYEVSDLGRVRSFHRCPPGNTQDGHILKPGNRGYHGYVLCRDGQTRNFTAHQLVMFAFVGPYPPGMEINHINGDKTDNRLLNLEYVTRSRNIAHAFKIGLKTSHPPHLQGEAHGSSKLTEQDVREILRLLKRGELSQSRIAARFCVGQTQISRIKLGVSWSYLSELGNG